MPDQRLGWHPRAISNLINDVIDYRGKTPTKAKNGIPCISAANVKNGLVTTGDKYISEEDYKTWTTRGFIKPGDVLITTEAPVAEVAQLPSDQTYLITRRVVALQVNPREADERFLMYALLDDQNKERLSTVSHGATVPRLYKEDILDFEIQAPPLETQRKISAVLSAYDDLIENNTRRIAILEEMAQALYREWFVHFRFPGHEDVKMVEVEGYGGIGRVPEGWEVNKVKEIVKRLRSGNTYRASSVNEDGAIPVVDQSRADFMGFHNNDPDHEATPDDPIIIFGDHTCKMQLMIQPFSLGPNVVPFTANRELSIHYLYFLVQNLVATKEYKRHWTELGNKQVCIAPNSLALAFADFVVPIFGQIELLRAKNITLSQTRDLLLPRLISGELDISEVDTGAT